MARVHGPIKFYLNKNEVVLILVGRNVSFYIDEFIEHHRSLGAEYLIYIDNGSTDDSISRASSYNNVIVATCTVDFRRYQRMLRYFSATLFAEGGWRLVLDADEMFDYFGSTRLALPDLAQYLTTRGHTGLVAQMLEMVPPSTLPIESVANYEDSIRNFNTYSLGNISSYDYYDENIRWSWFLKQNSLADPLVKIMFGGLRRTLFGEDCCLSKHAFFRMGTEVTPLPHPHVTTGLHCTDFTGLIRHYKFSGDFLARERERIENNLLSHQEAQLRMNVLEQNETLSFVLPDTQFDPTLEGLLDQGFLAASGAARRVLLD